MKKLIPLCFALALTPGAAFSQVIVNDSWASGLRSSPPNDAAWWYSTSSSAIEVGTGYLGLVSGGSGRGIAGTFASQTLGIGDTLTATFTFTTPATVGNNKSSSFRAGFFDTTGHPGLAADISASSGSPNPVYNNVNGYMMDYDVNTSTAGADITVRERSNPASGQLLATTSDYTSLGNGGIEYFFAPNTSYTGVFSVTRTGADTLDLTGSLFQGSTQLSIYTTEDSSGITSSFGMLAFQVGSSTFGSSSTVNAADNGIDFTNIKVEYFAAPVPEPSTFALLGAGGLLVLLRTRKLIAGVQK